MGRKAQRASRLFGGWKREIVPDHKFDFIDLTEFRSHNCLNHIRYFIMYIAIILSIATYCADIWSAIILLVYDQWSLSVPPKIPMYISKWIYVGCIALSFIFLAWDIRKARIAMASRDISYAVTNNIVYRYMSVKSYNAFCLFIKIQKSRKFSDTVAFYVYFTLKGWKNLLFAQGPRQIIAGFTVAALFQSAWTDHGNFKFNSDWDVYGKDWQQRIALLLMSFTCLYWIFRMLNLILALILYIPVFCQIKGNLKEYCCHKIDKRITEILEKQRRKRLREQEKKSNQQYQHGKKKHNNNIMEDTIAKPTLPILDESTDLYSDKRPLYQDFYYNHSTEMMAYPMSEPATPYQHHQQAMASPLPPMPQRAYTQPQPHRPYIDDHTPPPPRPLPTSSHYDDYYDEKSYVSDQSSQYHPSSSASPYMTPQYTSTQYSSPATQHTSPYIDHQQPYSYAGAGSAARQQHHQQQYHHQYTS
ncbi:hypothetical protein BJ944DRAFT_264305 [Cunninghamella echinulata]|nr:hypothetical protein BJ944DRAFT_264305 [Cunninghamella echinulata]